MRRPAVIHPLGHDTKARFNVTYNLIQFNVTLQVCCRCGLLRFALFQKFQ